MTIRATEFDNKYNLNLENNRLKYRIFDLSTYEQMRLFPNDILIEKSGGSEYQPVGRVAFIEEEFINKYSLAYSNFINKISVNELEVYPKYLFEYLKLMHNIKVTEAMQTQTNGIRNLIMNEFFNQPIILPNIDIQIKISKKIEEIRKNAKILEDNASNILKTAKEKVEKIILEGNL